MTPTRAAIYCRISQDREGAGLGIDRQREDCEKLAGSMGWLVVAVHTDNDVSAFSGKPRPGYRALLADLEAGRADAVLVWHTDRLHRSPRELEDFISLCEKRKIVTQTVRAGSLDLNTPNGRAQARTFCAWARQEVEHKSDRIKAAQLQKAAAGKWIGGTPPLGWDVRVKSTKAKSYKPRPASAATESNPDGSATLNPEAAAAIREATTAILAGAPLGSIVAEWNRRGFKAPRGRQWNYSSLRQVLTRARNAGFVEYNGELSPSTWPAIVTEDAWRSLCAMLADPSRRRSQSNRAKWLLSGIAICGKAGCGARLRSATVGSNRAGQTKRTVYRCVAPGTGHVARSAVDVDRHIDAVLTALFSRDDVRALVHTEGDVDVVALQSTAVELRARLNEAAESFADGAISGTQLAKITARVNEQLAEVEGALASASRDRSFAGIVNAHDPAAAWQAATIDRKRAIVAELITVTVLPGLRGKVYDPDLVQIDWR